MNEALPEEAPLRLPDPCLVVLVGATGSGKTRWASEWFEPDQVVSSDRLRAMVGAGERDQRASRDAFELLDLIVEKRLKRRLTTVVDTTGLEAKRRDAWRSLAERHGVPAYAVVFDSPAAVVRKRNRERGTPVPSKVVTAQLRALPAVAERLADEGFAGVRGPGPASRRGPLGGSRRPASSPPTPYAPSWASTSAISAPPRTPSPCSTASPTPACAGA